ncbi:Hypothetical predicted protein [Octopus vulgaris]|uniref:Uncharacterized protein n=1 Tax=Octopus vulgaris TaxID=6645 RepID=A0AA36EZ95_OCTVU|nr:Hypothetical predicted protein [Octopus vulgaris]
MSRYYCYICTSINITSILLIANIECRSSKLISDIVRSCNRQRLGEKDGGKKGNYNKCGQSKESLTCPANRDV